MGTTEKILKVEVIVFGEGAYKILSKNCFTSLMNFRFVHITVKLDNQCFVLIKILLFKQWFHLNVPLGAYPDL